MTTPSPAAPEPRIPVVIRLRPSAVAELDQLAADRETSRSAVARIALRLGLAALKEGRS